jgi:hypothetical protein
MKNVANYRQYWFRITLTLYTEQIQLSLPEDALCKTNGFAKHIPNESYPVTQMTYWAEDSFHAFNVSVRLR